METKVVDVEAPYWVTTTVRFHGFDVLPTSESKISPQFLCLGYKWALELTNEDTFYVPYCRDHVSRRTVRLVLRDRKHATSVKVHYQFFIEVVSAHQFRGLSDDCCPSYTFKTSSASCHDKNGTLSIQIRLATDKYHPHPHPQTFIPSNPSACKLIQDSFMAEDSADVVIEVAENEEGNMSPTTKFYAHYFILKRASPLLAELCKLSNDSPSRVQLAYESPDNFKDMLLYIYGFQIPAFGNNPERTKKIIEIANKYGVTNLKIEAEVSYVSSLSLSLGNIAELLFFAESMNCALLKELALEFIVNNAVDVAEKKLLIDAPASLFNDILLATALKNKTGEGIDTMSVNELRRLSHQKELDIDGTREMLIAGLQQQK